MTADNSGAPKPPPPIPLWEVLRSEYRELHASGTKEEWEAEWQAELDRVSSRLQPGEELSKEQREVIVRGLVHRLQGDSARSALCLSGGGIRSASFGLGVLQGLARNRQLSKFHYLSTVSGGGYIGSWFSAWVHRHQDGLSGVERDLKASITAPADILTDSHPVQQLRRYSNYLSPRTGAFSPDTWTLISTFIRNLLANWLVLLPWLLLLLLIPRVMIGAVGYPWFANQPVRLWLVGVVIGLAWFSCLISVKYAHDEDAAPDAGNTKAEKIAEVAGDFLVSCLIPMVVSALVLVIAMAWYRIGQFPRFLTVGALSLPVGVCGGGLFGASAHWVGWLISTEKRQSWKSDAGILGSGLLAGLLGGVGAQLALDLPEKPIWLIGYVWLAPALLLFLFVLGTNLYSAWAGIKDRKPDSDLEWYARMGAYVLRAATVWLLASGVVFYGPLLFDLIPKLVSISGVIALFSSSVISGWSGSTESGRKSEQVSRSSRALELATRVAGPVFLAVLLAWLSALTSLVAGLTRNNQWARVFWDDVPNAGELGIPFGYELLRGSFNHLVVLCEFNFLGLATLALVIFGIFRFAARNVALNKFSLHHMYRERLIRAYLGATRKIRRPDAFTGFDPDDNLPIGALWPLAIEPDSVFDGPGLIDQIRREEGRIIRGIRAQLSAEFVAMMESPRFGGDIEMVLPSFCFEFNNFRKPLELGSLATQEAPLPRYLQDAYDSMARTPVDQRDAYQIRLLNRRLFDQACGPALHGAKQLHGSRPLHLVNMTLNLASDPELAWQDRKGESFTVSPLHAGSGDPILGYRPTDYPVDGEKRYGGDNGISLGTAMAISGAAASPNMGYHSSPVVTFLLTLFNARLGWWLGNPGEKGGATYPDYYVKKPVAWLLRELRGRTNRTAEYVYLSDGGHFENLGLYEVVRRRCRYVVVSDAGCDPAASFEDLGNAIRKIRIDMGIPIEFPQGIPIYSRKQSAEDKESGKETRHYAVARIGYSKVDRDADGHPQEDGWLLYLKPAVYGDEPLDVRNYATKHDEFPHETTADQWFSEAQLESYRALGLYSVSQALPESDRFEPIGQALQRLQKRPSGKVEWKSAL